MMRQPGKISVKATAGIHFMKVLKALGIDAELAARLRPFPNGATALREISHCPEMGLSGCTQVTEILNTPGITLVARLPKEFELATVYTAADLIELLTDADTAALRCSAGFEIAARGWRECNGQKDAVLCARQRATPYRDPPQHPARLHVWLGAWHGGRGHQKMNAII